MPHLPEILSHPNLPQFCNDTDLLGLLRDPTTPAETCRQIVYLLCYQDFERFVTTFFPDHCKFPFSQMHRDFFQAEAHPSRRGRREATAAPRGHAKTTIKVIFKVLHAIVYGYEPFIMIIGHSAPEAQDKVRDILHELETNTLLQEVYGHLAPQRGKPGWGTKDFITLNGTRVLAKSRGKQVRGLKHGTHRPTLIILDDCESPDKVLNESQRYKTRQWFEKDILKLGSVDGQANIMLIGTCLHPEALLPNLLHTPGWKGQKYQAVSQFASNQALWQEWKAIYTDLTNPRREADAEAFFVSHRVAMLEGTEVLWPEAEPYERLMKLMIDEGQASFQSEKQNDPYDPERQIFDMAAAKRFRLEYLPDGEFIGFRLADGSERLIPPGWITRWVAYHDPAMAEGKDADYAAIVVCANDLNGYIYCVDAYIEKVTPSRQIEQALAMHQKWNLDAVYLEDNNFQGILKHCYQSMQDENVYLRVKGVTQHHNKVKRIASLEPLISNGQLLFNVDLSPRLISQLQLFPTTHDDGPDALHGAVSQLHPGSMRFR